MVFILWFINMLYHVDWFVDVKPSFHSWNESRLVMVYNPFNILLNLVCYYFFITFLSLFFEEII